MKISCRLRRSSFVRPTAVALAIALALAGALPGAIAPRVVHASDVTAPPPPPPRPAIVGFADTHLHQFANLGFGGLEMWGSPMDPTLDPNASLEDARRRALPSSDFIYLTGAQAADYLAAVGLPVTSSPSASSCDDGSCWAECPDGTGVSGNPCWRVEIHGTSGSADLLNKLVGSNSYGHGTMGYPDLDGWPAWDVVTVQQAYWEWLQRAHDHGMKLMVMLAVNNAVLCNLGIHKASFGCGDDGSVNRQIQGAKDLEGYIDARAGGAGMGFYKIVYSSADARQAIQAGKLAVVLGTEVDTEWGCTPNNASCDDALVGTHVQSYYDQGIRVVYPVHLIDNKFGGSSQYTGVFELNNFLVNGSFFDIVSTCDSRLQWRSDVRSAISSVKIGVNIAIGVFLATGGAALPALLLAAAPVVAALPVVDLFLPLLGTVLPLVGLAVIPLVALIEAMPGEVGTAPQPNCNAKTLSTVGETLINALMDHRMIIDIDHTDTPTSDAILDIAVSRHYPGIVAGHTGLVGAGLTKDEVEALGKEFNAAETARHEGNKTDEQVQRINSLGGFVSIILHQGRRDRIRDYDVNDNVPFDCGESSESWAQVYLYATKHLGLSAVGIGSDMNGFAGMPGPRYGPRACGKHDGSDPNADYEADPVHTPQQVNYTGLTDYYGQPLPKYQFGNRTWDYNVDGLAHVGLYPDFIADLMAIGMTPADLAPLFNSAEAYVRMWEKVDDNQPPVVTCGTVGQDWHADDVTVPCNAYDFGWGLLNASDANFSLSTSVAAGDETANALTGVHAPVCDAGGHCTASIPAIGAIRVDKKDPVVLVNTPAAGTPAYLLHQTVLADYSCTDGGSGIATCAGPVASGAELDTSVGAHAFAVNGLDNVNHSVSVSHPYNVTFAICPLYDATKAKKAGSTVPIRLQICDANGVNTSSAGIVLTATGVTQLSTSAPGVLDDAGNSNPDNNFRFDAATGSYVYNLQTTGFQVGTYALTFTATGDPIPHSVQFQIK